MTTLTKGIKRKGKIYNADPKKPATDEFNGRNFITSPLEDTGVCPHLDCLVNHNGKPCTCDMRRYCPQCKGEYAFKPVEDTGEAGWEKKIRRVASSAGWSKVEEEYVVNLTHSLLLSEQKRWKEETIEKISNTQHGGHLGDCCAPKYVKEVLEALT